MYHTLLDAQHLEDAAVSCLHRLWLLLQNESENKHLQLALMAEGATGLWDLTCDRQLQQQIGLTGQALHGLMAALRKPVLSAELHLPAVCAAWQACVMAKSRERLIQVGVTWAPRGLGHATMYAIGQGTACTVFSDAKYTRWYTVRRDRHTVALRHRS